MVWAAGFSVAAELEQAVLDLVLDRFLDVLRAQNQHVFTARLLGPVLGLDVELEALRLEDLRDPPPIGAVQVDLRAQAGLELTLLGVVRARLLLQAVLDDLSLDMAKTPAGLPRGIAVAITPTFALRLAFTGRNLLGRLFAVPLNLVAALIRLGVWLAFRILRRVEVPVWELVDVFTAIGLRFTPGSPLLTAQGGRALLVASDFNLTAPGVGDPALLRRFAPANTNASAVVHERVVAAGVDLAFTRGWVPRRLYESGFRIDINAVAVAFEPDTIVATGAVRAKRGRCWCRVKARIQFRVGIEPRVVDDAAGTRLEFDYDADVNVHVSTSGLLVVLGVLMFAPVFIALTMLLSSLINLVLDQFLPFTTTFQRSGLTLTVTATSVKFAGFVPLSMTFPLELHGSGSYDLARFRTFALPAGAGTIDVGYTNESLSVGDEEVRAAVLLS